MLRLKKIFSGNIFFSLLAGAFFLNTVFAANNQSIQIKGSDTMVNLVQGWAEGFMQKDSKTMVAVTGGGSGTGLAALINGSCNIAMSSRNVSPKEVALASKKGIEIKEFKVALDGLAVVVHPDNPVSKLTLDQLADIFAGRVTNWNQVGGADGPIVVLSREVNSGTHVYFKEHVLRKGDTKSKEEFSPDALMLPSSQAIADEITQNKNAIGYYGMGYIGKSHKALLIAKSAAEEAYAPTEVNIRGGQYPISRPLFIYTNGEPQGDVKLFMDFMLSAEGQAVVTSLDFVPIQ